MCIFNTIGNAVDAQQAITTIFLFPLECKRGHRHVIIIFIIIVVVIAIIVITIIACDLPCLWYSRRRWRWWWAVQYVRRLAPVPCWVDDGVFVNSPHHRHSQRFALLCFAFVVFLLVDCLPACLPDCLTDWLMRTLPHSLNYSTHSHVFALLLWHLYNGLAISFFLSFFLSFDLTFGGAWDAIDLAQCCSSFIVAVVFDGRQCHHHHQPINSRTSVDDAWPSVRRSPFVLRRGAAACCLLLPAAGCCCRL